ncbi:serine/threonine protein kinase [Corynebacteriales bacterium D3-21]|uniref:Serine/threonine protein kinase n=2 Tax=Speluncibacter jeojiensis TaxID=2710754 RepID=A0A9X4M2M4_9ACTN|nr:serine/threonine-protein kinase [Rhodococcus sp. D2-41]MDG3016920.1 serine/threonine protein kinase [Corynebacteriales bacterium D3-21]
MRRAFGSGPAGSSPAAAVAGGAPTEEPTRAAEPPAPDSLDAVEAGQRLDDFDLLVGLGRGAFARVFLARQRSMQRLVAVKISQDSGTEPQTLAQLDHDYIVRVFDQRLLEERRLRVLYMQYVPGGTLLGVLRRVRDTPPEMRRGRLLLEAIDDVLAEKAAIRPSDSAVRAQIAQMSWPDTVAWLGRRLADALNYAGEHGVLHRDIKPANVLLTEEGVPKLADFNISFSSAVAGASPVAYFGGSLAYMSPEQLEACHPGMAGTAADLDTRSDLYALGVMLWELLTGARPFADREDPAGADPDDDPDTEDALQHMLDLRRRAVPAQAQERLPADCPAALRRVLLTCLAPDPGDRWATGAELAQQFDLCLDVHARDLVDPPPRSPRARASRWPAPILAAGIGIPNGVAALYNYHHNKSLIVDGLDPQVQARFDDLAQVINLIVFSLGALLILYFCRRLLTVPPGLRAGRTYDARTLARVRADSLLLGDRVVVVCGLLWLASGIAFPLLLQAAGGSLPTYDFVHFVASQAVCGAMAVAYPFFAVAFYCVRCLYPALLPHGGPGSAADGRKLRGLVRRSIRYLAVAASVPLVAVVGVTFLSHDDFDAVIVAVRVLCVGSIFAFIGAYWLFRMLEADLRALERVVATAPRTT